MSRPVFKDSIVSLCLSVCLGVEGSGEGSLNAEESAEFREHITCKARVSV